MSDDEDLELQALQRQLDDAFETTRPRAAFEDELWLRMQARRPFWWSAWAAFAGLIDSIRRAPAAPATAVAVVLIVAIGVGIVSRGGFHFGGGASTTSTQAGGAPAYNASRAAGAFGPLPTPALQPVSGTADTGGPKAVSPTEHAVGNAYLGPSRLTWAGQLNIQITTAPVFRYQEPTTLDADRFATALGASPAKRTPGALGEYSSDGFALGIVGSSRQPLGEPVFYITPDRSKLPPPGPSPTATASAFLSAHSLVPTWPYVVAVDQIADVVRVSYLRQFNVPAFGLAYLVNASGVRYGLEVDIRSDQPLQAFGPLPLNLDSADYSIISADQAVRAALASSRSAPASAPTIRLTSAELVYALANAGDHSFYEPALLFSGTFTQNGVTYVKHVLVPAVGPQ